MLLRKIDGYVGVVIDKEIAKEQAYNIVNGLFNWLVAGVIAVGILAVIAGGAYTYGLLTSLL